MLKNKKNELYIKEENKTIKFCRICAQTLRGEVKLLKQHLVTQHDGVGEPEWLKAGEDPADCIWTNWQQFKDDPTNVTLEMIRERRRALHTQRGWFEPKAGLTAWRG